MLQIVYQNLIFVLFVLIIYSRVAEFHVWVVGSSIMRRAFVTDRNKHGGVCLGLQRLGINIWWQGKGGMVWLDMYLSLIHI